MQEYCCCFPWCLLYKEFVLTTIIFKIISFQMQPEATDLTNSTLAESNLLQSSTIQIPATAPVKAPVNIDDMPIGGGTKFQLSEFPDEGAPPPKPPVRKAPVKKKKEEPVKEPESTQTPASNVAQENFDQKPLPAASKASSFDDMPIGGGSGAGGFDDKPVGKSGFSIPEFPDEGAPPPTKAPVKRAPIKKKKEQPKDTSQAPPPPTQNFDDKPLASGRPNAFDEMPIGGKSNNPFDQKPIGKSNFNMSEFPPEQEEQPANSTNLTFDQKLKSKAIKVRLGAFEELLAMLGKGDISESPLSEVEFDKLLKESNPGCLEKVLLSFQLWTKKDGNWGDQEIKQLIENGFINGKGASKKVSQELLDYMYQKKPQNVEAVVVAGLKGKTIKTVTGYITVLNFLLPIYGIKKLGLLKPYYPDVIRLISTEKLPAIKTEGMNLLKQAMKWLTKDFLEPYFKTNNLKEGLKKELDAFWETYDKTAVMSAPKADPETKKGGAGGAGKIDIYAESEEVDVFRKFNEKWSQTVLKTQKWKQKTDLMQQLVNACSVPRIANTQFRHIIDMIKRLINDSNMNVVMMDLKVLGALAKGLRKNFSPYAKMFFGNVISKFRDKKTLMIEQTNNCLNEFNHCFSIEEVLDDIKEGLADKNPEEKKHLMNWLERTVDRRVRERLFGEKAKDGLRALFPNLEKLCNDGAAEVRENTTKAICSMKNSLGDDFFAALETKLGKTLAAKPEKGGAKKEKQHAEDLSKTTMNLASSAVMSKPPTAPGSTTNALSKTMAFPPQKGGKQQQAPVEQKAQQYQVPTFEECCQTLLGQGLSDDDLKVVTSGTAKEKTALLETLKNDELDFEAVLKILRKMYKQWKQSNLVMNKQLFAFLSSNTQKIGKRQFYIILPCLLQKLGDSKFSQPLSIITDSATSRIPPKFFTLQVLKYVKPSDTRKPSPKLNGQVCNFLCDFIDKVSLSYVPFKDVVEFAKECYQVPLSKKGAVSLFKKLYEYMGESLKVCLDQATAKGLDAEFKKTNVLSEAEKRPKVEFRGEAQSQVKHQKVVNPLDTLPRANIENEVAKFLPKINDDKNWQTRKQGVESLDALLTQNQNRVLMNGLTDLITALKSRINDPNKSLCKMFISFTAHLIESVGKDIRIHSKVLILALIEVLADKTQAIRKESAQALTRIGHVLGMDLIVGCMGQPLESDKVEFRAEVLNFLLTNDEHLGKIQGREFAKGVVCCLCDKNKDIRAGSERLLEKIHERIGMDYLRQVAKDVKPAFIKDLTAIFDKIDKNAGNSGPGNSAVRGNSPAKPQPTFKKPPISAKKDPTLSSTMANNASASNLSSTLQSQHLSASSVMSRTMTAKQNFGEQTVPPALAFNGDEPIAGQKFLSIYRQQRLEQEETAPWTYDNIKETKEEELLEELNRSFRRDIVSKMVALDYRKLNDAGLILSKMCKDLSLHASLRQVADVLLKWILLRLWGGCLPASSLMQLVPQLLSILQKRSVTINDHQVSLVLSIIRQYCMANASHEVRVNQTLHTIAKCLIKLHSGDRVLKAIIKQYGVDLLAMHKHGKRESNPYYRETLNRVIKNNMMDFVGNQEILIEISRIKELNRDAEFLDMLFQRFNQTALMGYGFRRDAVAQHNQHSSSVEKMNTQNSNATLNNSQVRANPNIPPFPNKVAPPTPPPMQQYPSTQMMQNPASLKKVESASNISPGINVLPPTPSPSSFSGVNYNPTPNNPPPEPTLLSRLTLGSYPCPHPSSPLSQHLSKLNPPNDQTLTFFQTLFVQASDKITSELQNYAKIILAAILKANIVMLERRNDYPPEKIVNQLNLLQQTLKNRHVIRNVGEVLAVATEFVLRQLVYEDQNKAMIAEALRERGIDFKTENFIKIINGVMLRILENAHPHQITIILFDLLIKTLKKPTVSQKTVCLIIKCIGRVSNGYVSELQEVNLIELILKFHQYCTELQSRLKPEDAGLKIIENMLGEISKQVKENIWNSYEKAMSQTAIPDDFIVKHLQALRIPYPQKSKPSQKQQQLKKITQLLSKYKTYQAGIGLLNSFLDQNPDFQISQYFTNLNYDIKFINKVLNSLQSNFKRPPPRGIVPQAERRSQDKKKSIEKEMTTEDNNIESKIRSLRQRFDQMHRNDDIHNQMQNPPVQNREEADPDRASEIRRRITEMKAKINNSIRS